MIHVSSPALIGREREYVLDAIDSADIAIGSYLPRFESDFAAFAGTRHALACNSGTSALILALEAIGTKPGDEVIIPALTYIATANAVSYFGATPVIVDVDPETWCMDPLDVRERLSPRTKAVIPVHLYGHPVDIDEIKPFLPFYTYLIEDAAEAHGALYKGRRVGSLGDIGCFSFYGNKIITTGEGGMVTTNADHLRRRMLDYRDGYTHGARRYEHDGIGFNFRMSNLSAAFGVGQLEQIDSHLHKRQSIREMYEAMLPDGVTLQARKPWATAAEWMVTVVLDEFWSRDSVMQHLGESGIETRPTFRPVHLQPPYFNGRYFLPEAEWVADHGINLPTHVNLTSDDVAFVCFALADALKGRCCAA